MKNHPPFGIVLTAFALAASAPGVETAASAQATSVQAPHLGEGGLPQFQRDPEWPKVPAKWRVGSVSAVAIDTDDHVWILTRPHTLPAQFRAMAAPPVMEFDNAGNFIQGWGGESGPGYQWPSNEHGLTVDDKGFVWIVGNADGKSNNPANLPNDNQILKFTKAGTFVMAIGQSGQTGSNKTEILRGAAGLRVNARTNELFVADGYGNSRVMVYDGETGKFKRMWGAYGRPPLDVEDRPKRSPPAGNPWVAVSEVLQQFGSPVHDVDVSRDDLVYVADRGNKRIQVFTLEGRFVAEQFVGLDSPFPFQARSVAISPDQRFLYVGGSPAVYILNRKTLEILGSFTIDVGAPERSPGHQMAADHKGNIYVVQADAEGADRKSGGSGAYRYLFKGFSPATP
jgi:DNA-binding beta-propeller fold protein YncE